MSGNLTDIGNLTEYIELFYDIPGAIDKMEQQFKDMRAANHREVLEAWLTILAIILAHHSYLHAVEQKQVQDPFGCGFIRGTNRLFKAIESLRHTGNSHIRCKIKDNPVSNPSSSIISDLNLHPDWVNAKEELWKELVGIVELVGELAHVNHGVSEEDRKSVETFLRSVGPGLALRPSRSAGAASARDVANRHAVTGATDNTRANAPTASLMPLGIPVVPGEVQDDVPYAQPQR